MIIDIKKYLTEVEYNIIILAGKLIDTMGIKGYLVGGMIRDMIVGRTNIDIDISVEGDGISFAKNLMEILNSNKYNAKLTIFEKFMTASIDLYGVVLDSDSKQAGIEESNSKTEKALTIDIASMRKEVYQRPGVLPEVSYGNFEDDIKRRDFTINCLAFSLNKQSFGKIFDIVNGYNDLQNEVLSILHNKSFIDDPTRIIRGVRFHARDGYRFDTNTLRLLRESVKSNVFKTVSKDRIAYEIKLVLSEKNCDIAFKYLKGEGILSCICPNCEIYKKSIELLKEVKQYHEDYNVELLNILAILYKISDASINVLDIFCTGKKIIEQVQRIPNARRDFGKLVRNKTGNLYKVFNTLNEYSDEMLIVLMLGSRSKAAKLIHARYVEAKRRSIIETTGDDLLQIGIKPGTIYRTIFDKIREQKIHGKLVTKLDELEYVERLKTTLS